MSLLENLQSDRKTVGGNEEWNQKIKNVRKNLGSFCFGIYRKSDHVKVIILVEGRKAECLQALIKNIPSKHWDYSGDILYFRVSQKGQTIHSLCNKMKIIQLGQPNITNTHI